MQGFRNSGKGSGGSGIRNFTWGIFLPGEGNKEYEIRTKIEQEQ